MRMSLIDDVKAVCDRLAPLGWRDLLLAVTNHELDISAATPATLAELRQRTGAQQLSIVVFAYEYRPAKDTCNGQHADVAFSRTGIARVGTRAPRYDPVWRGFTPEDQSDPFGIRVCPARYGV